MSRTSTFEVKFKRRNEGKTNYKKRLAMLKSGIARAVIRKSNYNMQVQVINYDKGGDVTVATANSKELAAMGWKHHTGNTSAAYLTGYLCGVRAKEKGVDKAVVDIGLISPVHGSRVFAAAKGFADSGINVPIDAEALPKEGRIKGAHIKNGPPSEFDKVLQEIRKK